MTRRLVSVASGVAFGVTLGVLAMRQVTASTEGKQPMALARRLMLGAGEFVTDVRVAMAEREQELRSGLGLGVDADVDVAELEVPPAPSGVPGRLGG